MTESPDTYQLRSTTQVFEDHLMKRLGDKVEEDIKENYSPNVILLTGTGAFHGYDGVRQSAAELTRYLGEGKFVYRHTLVEDEYAFLEWTAVSGSRAVLDGADSFVIRNGKIIFQSIHYTAVKR